MNVVLLSLLSFLLMCRAPGLLCGPKQSQGLELGMVPTMTEFYLTLTVPHKLSRLVVTQGKGCEYSTKLVHCCFQGSVMGERSGQLCVITRCNYTLFNEAVNVCCANNNTKVGFVGVGHNYFVIVCLYNTSSCESASRALLISFQRKSVFEYYNYNV